jgi:hypothetical protein
VGNIALLASYRNAVVQLTEATVLVKHWEQQVREHERQLSDSHAASGGSAPAKDAALPVPRRLQNVMNVLLKHGVPMRLTDIENEVTDPGTTSGIRQQLVVLKMMGRVRQVDRGLYEAVSG